MLSTTLPPPPVETQWYVEYPANPNLLCLHTRWELTHAMSERYEHATFGQHQTWHTPLLSIPGLTQVTVLRHHLRLRKQREANWAAILDSVRSMLSAHSSLWHELTETQQMERKRTLRLPQPWVKAGQHLVYEGVDVAQEHPLASALFAFPGLLLVVLEQDELHLKRAMAYHWDELMPHIEVALSQGTPLTTV